MPSGVPWLEPWGGSSSPWLLFDAELSILRMSISMIKFQRQLIRALKAMMTAWEEWLDSQPQTPV